MKHVNEVKDGITYPCMPIVCDAGIKHLPGCVFAEAAEPIPLAEYYPSLTEEFCRGCYGADVGVYGGPHTCEGWRR